MADFLIIVLKYLVERVCPNYPDFEPSTYLVLFGKKYSEMIAKVKEITEDRSRFWTFTKERNFKNEFDFDLDVLSLVSKNKMANLTPFEIKKNVA